MSKTDTVIVYRFQIFTRDDKNFGYTSVFSTENFLPDNKGDIYSNVLNYLLNNVAPANDAMHILSLLEQDFSMWTDRFTMINSDLAVFMTIEAVEKSNG